MVRCSTVSSGLVNSCWNNTSKSVDIKKKRKYRNKRNEIEKENKKNSNLVLPSR